MAGLLHQGVSQAFILRLSKLIRTVPRCHTNEIVRAAGAGTTAEDSRGQGRGSGADKGLKEGQGGEV